MTDKDSDGLFEIASALERVADELAGIRFAVERFGPARPAPEIRSGADDPLDAAPNLAEPDPPETVRSFREGVGLGWALACDCVQCFGIEAARGHVRSLERWLADPAREGIPLPGDDVLARPKP